MNLNKEIGGTEYYVMENIGATETDRNLPFLATIPLDVTYEYFFTAVNLFEPSPYGFSTNHFFIFGKNPNWGIYICENPMLQIIGCSEELILKFSEVFKFENYGLPELNKFIAQEFQYHESEINEMMKNYDLKS